MMCTLYSHGFLPLTHFSTYSNILRNRIKVTWYSTAHLKLAVILFGLCWIICQYKIISVVIQILIKWKNNEDLKISFWPETNRHGEVWQYEAGVVLGKGIFCLIRVFFKFQEKRINKTWKIFSLLIQLVSLVMLPIIVIADTILSNMVTTVCTRGEVGSWCMISCCCHDRWTSTDQSRQSPLKV